MTPHPACVAVAELGRTQGNMLGRRQLYALGCTRSEVRAEIQARRWRRRGKQCVQVGDPDATSDWWRALHLEVALAAGDMLKQNAASLSGKVVLRIPNFAFRADPEPFLDQMEAVFRARGWAPSLRQRKRAS